MILKGDKPGDSDEHFSVDCAIVLQLPVQQKPEVKGPAQENLSIIQAAD